jgi:hypothetical protein
VTTHDDGKRIVGHDGVQQHMYQSVHGTSSCPSPHSVTSW